MVCMTIAYTALALAGLGCFNVPQTSWQPQSSDDYVTVDLGKNIAIDRFYFYWKGGSGQFSIDYMNTMNQFSPVCVIENPESTEWWEKYYEWSYVQTDITTRYLKIRATKPGATLNEMFIVKRGTQVPYAPIVITEKSNHTGYSQGVNADKTVMKVANAGQLANLSVTNRPENLFDEQNTFDYLASFLSSCYYDERDDMKTAYQYLHRMTPPEEHSHPPLGKVLLSLGMVIFGVTPFGWRFSGTMFGVAMIPVMYMFGKKLFYDRMYAFCAAFLMMFDFAHFSQTRIATLEPYSVLFILLMFYCMYLYVSDTAPKKNKALVCSAIFFGLGVASKWNALFGGAGLVLIFLMFSRGENRVNLKTITVLFVVITPIIYVLSYIPFMMVSGIKNGLLQMIDNQKYMLDFHVTFNNNDHFASRWWQWPFVTNPLVFYSQQGGGYIADIVSMGNPAIWWMTIPAVAGTIFLGIKKRDKRVLVLITAIASLYLPWIIFSRTSYIYYFFVVLPFVIFAIIYVMQHLIERYPKLRWVLWGYLALTMALFIVFYPILVGMAVPQSYVSHLQWFKQWDFFCTF